MRERKLERALERLLAVAERADVVMRSGNCPKCGAEPVTPAGDFDETFALEMCSDEDWLDIRDAVIEAEEALSDVRLDRGRPGRYRLAEVNRIRVELDLLEHTGLVR